MLVAVSGGMRAPADVVRDAYADFERWPEIFPTISAVRLRGRRGATIVLDVDYVEGTVSNEVTVTPDGELVLAEVKRRYDAVFANRFEPAASGCTVTVTGRLRFKGWVRLLAPFLGRYVARQIRRFQLEPLRRAVEGS